MCVCAQNPAWDACAAGLWHWALGHSDAPRGPEPSCALKGLVSVLERFLQALHCLWHTPIDPGLKTLQKWVFLSTAAFCSCTVAFSSAELQDHLFKGIDDEAGSLSLAG